VHELSRKVLVIVAQEDVLLQEQQLYLS
jgi:hypothetical protein